MSDAFKGQPLDVQKCSFTVKYGRDNKKLNITAKTEYEAQLWMKGLGIMWKYIRDGEVNMEELKNVPVILEDKTRRNSVAVMNSSRRFSLANRSKSDTRLQTLKNELA